MDFVPETLQIFTCFWQALLHSVCYFFFLYRSLSLSLCRVFYSISSNMNKILLINPSANVFVFGDFKVHHKDWITYSGGTDKSDELLQFFLKTLLRWLRFLFGSPHSPALLIYLFLLMLVFVLQWLSLHWEILIMLRSQFPLTFHHSHNGMPCFNALLLTIPVLIETVFLIIWEMFHAKISLNSELLLLLVNFASGLRLGLMYVPLIESIRSSATHLHGFQVLVLLP